jgi:hypothetical protein
MSVLSFLLVGVIAGSLAIAERRRAKARAARAERVTSSSGLLPGDALALLW